MTTPPNHNTADQSGAMQPTSSGASAEYVVRQLADYISNNGYPHTRTGDEIQRDVREILFCGTAESDAKRVLESKMRFKKPSGQPVRLNPVAVKQLADLIISLSLRVAEQANCANDFQLCKEAESAITELVDPVPIIVPQVVQVPDEKICRQAWNDMYHKCRPEISYESFKYIWQMCIDRAAPSPTEQASDVRNAALEEAIDELDRFPDSIEFRLVKDAINSLKSATPAATSANPSVDIDQLVNRFLSWKLPQTFSPDCGISFKLASPYSFPVGTNLFHAGEAKEMFLHCLATPEDKGNAPDEVQS